MQRIQIVRGILVGAGVALVTTVVLRSILLAFAIGLGAAVITIVMVKGKSEGREVQRSNLKMLSFVLIILSVAAAITALAILL